jgi:hypothetical protein
MAGLTITTVGVQESHLEIASQIHQVVKDQFPL